MTVGEATGILPLLTGNWTGRRHDGDETTASREGGDVNFLGGLTGFGVLSATYVVDCNGQRANLCIVVRPLKTADDFIRRLAARLRARANEKAGINNDSNWFYVYQQG